MLAEQPATRTKPCTNAVFQQPWWLEALAPGRWGEATVRSGGQTIARLPYVVRGRGRLRVLTMPPLTQTLGPWVARSTAKRANALGEELEVLEQLQAALPRAAAFTQHFAPAMLNALPFYWSGYRLEVRYTYRLTGLGTEDALWDNLRGNIRREIRKARKQLVVHDGAALDVFHDVWSKTFERQGLPAPVSLEQLTRLDEACALHDARWILEARDERDRVHAVAYVVWDENAAFYLLGGGDPVLRTSGASSLLMWESIMRARAVTDVFDFEGSMLRPVERFFRAFGGRQTPYLRVSRATAAARAAMAARTTCKSLRARRSS